MNIVYISGRLGKEPELKSTSNGKTFVQGSIAVTGYSKEITYWINFQAWEKTAELISKYFTKGDMIGLKGEMQISSYETKDGDKKTNTFVKVDSIEFYPKPKKEEQKPPDNPFRDDDIPF